MNYYAILPFIGVLANLALFFLVLYKDIRSLKNRLYALATLSLSVWSVGNLIMFSTNNAVFALQAQKLASVGAVLTSIFFFHFFVVYVQNTIAKYLPIFYTVSLTLLYVVLGTDYITKGVQKAFWGFMALRGDYYPVFSLVIAFYIFVGLLVVAMNYKKSDNSLIKKQSRLLLVAVSIPLVGGIFSEIIPEILGIVFIPLTSTLTTVTSVLVGYAIIRYQLLTPERTTIGSKMIITTLLIALMSGGVGLLTIYTLQTEGERLVFINSHSIAQGIVSGMEESLEERVGNAAHLVESEVVIKALSDSNGEYSSFANTEKLISDVEADWLKSNTKELREELLSNEMANVFRDLALLLKKEYGNNIIGEIFVTNKYGANVAMTDTTSDFYQADEEWWIEAKKNGRYLSKVGFDKSADTYSIDVSKAVIDSEGTFLGVLKMVVDLNNSLEKVVKNKVTDISLGDNLVIDVFAQNKGKIYSTAPFVFYDDLPPSLMTLFDEHSNDYRYKSASGVDKLATHSHLKSVAGQHIGWAAVVTVNSNDVLGTLYALKRILLIVVFLSLLFSIIVGLIVSRSIAIPIKNLGEYIRKTSDGEVVKIQIKTGDEIETLANSFGEMIDKLSHYYSDLENQVKSRTSDLAEAKMYLKNQNSAILNMLEDISMEKDVSESKSQSILDNTAEGVIVTDNKGIINYLNPAGVKLLGYAPEDIKGKDVAEAIEAFDLKGKKMPVVNLTDSALLTAKEHKIKVLLANKSGKQTPVIVSAAPIRVKNEYVGVVRLIHDYSEELRVQKQKDDFFSIASHELRTPLTVISGNLDIITDTVKGKISKSEYQLMVDTESSADRLTKMVGDFLNVSRLDQGRVQSKIVSLDYCKLTDEVVKEMKALTDEKGLGLTFSCRRDHGNVLADEGFTKEILINLISNSVKFTNKGGITIEHFAKDDRVFTRVIDTGAGIAKEQQDLLFQRFQQAMTRTRAREVGGTGLGLFISREFAKIMGGDLYLASSTKNTGSTFEFHLPLDKTKTQKGEDKVMV